MVFYLSDGQLHDAVLGRICGVHFACDAAAGHHHHAVRHAENFGQFARHHQHGPALCGDLVDDVVDLYLRPDIDSARGLIEQ